MIKLRAPEGMTSFQHAGHPIEIGGDGSCLVDERHIGDFTPHGFTRWEAPRPEHQTLSHAAAEPGIDAERVDVLRRLAQIPTDDLRALLDSHPAERKPEAMEADRPSEEDIRTMPRGKMFQWLKSRSIAAQPSDNDDALRAKIRNAG